MPSFFDNWIEQCKVFYKIFTRVMYNKEECVGKYFSSYIRTINDFLDIQVPRTHGTFRMLYNRKLKKDSHKLKLDEPDKYNFYDSLIQIYRGIDLKSEQKIGCRNLNLPKLDGYLKDKDKKDYVISQILDNTKTLGSSVKYKNKIISDLDLSGREKEIMDLFQPFNGNIFSFRSCRGNIIELNRIISAPCLISQKQHENENAKLVVTDNCIMFKCYRKCEMDGHDYFVIHNFNNAPKYKFIVPGETKRKFKSNKEESYEKKTRVDKNIDNHIKTIKHKDALEHLKYVDEDGNELTRGEVDQQYSCEKSQLMGYFSKICVENKIKSTSIKKKSNPNDLLKLKRNTQKNTRYSSIKNVKGSKLLEDDYFNIPRRSTGISIHSN